MPRGVRGRETGRDMGNMTETWRESGYVGSKYSGGDILSVSPCEFAAGHGEHGVITFAGCAVQCHHYGGDRMYTGARIILPALSLKATCAVALSIL